MRPRTRPADDDRRDTAGRDVVSVALSACGLTLEAQLSRNAAPHAVRETIADFTRVAQLHGVPPERTLAVFKRMVGRLKSVARHDVVERAAIVNDLVQMAIETYYQSITDVEVR
jgi:hypothetical protein